MKKRLLIILGILLALVPLGLISENPAWGEWDISYYEKVLGFVPKGMQISLINPVIPDYEISGLGSVSGYYLSGILGSVLLFVIYFILIKLKVKK